MNSTEILAPVHDFFVERNHRLVLQPADPDDPTLLFVNAGMVPVQALLPRRGSRRRTARATACRSASAPRDIDEVGKTTAAQHVLPDGRQLLVRRLLQGGRHRATPGSWSPSRG